MRYDSMATATIDCIRYNCTCVEGGKRTWLGFISMATLHDSSSFENLAANILPHNTHWQMYLLWQKVEKNTPENRNSSGLDGISVIFLSVVAYKRVSFEKAYSSLFCLYKMYFCAATHSDRSSLASEQIRKKTTRQQFHYMLNAQCSPIYNKLIDFFFLRLYFNDAYYYICREWQWQCWWAYCPARAWVCFNVQWSG